MKAIRLEQGTMGNYRVFVDEQEVEIDGFVIDAEHAIFEALRQQGIDLSLVTKRGTYTWDAPYWKPAK